MTALCYGTLTAVAGQSGAVNEALSFTDGSKIRVASSNSLTFSTAFSYSTWIRLRSFAGRDGGTGLDGIGGIDCWPYFINGELDEMRFYNRPLTREEIQSMYLFEKAPIQSLKIGSWQDPSTLSYNCVPTSWDKIQIRHLITVPAGAVANARKVVKELGGKLKLEKSAKLRLEK